MDLTGTPVWDPAMVAVKTTATGTSRLAAARSSLGFGIYAWGDTDTDRDIHAAAVDVDGGLGATVIFVDGFESGDTSAWSTALP